MTFEKGLLQWRLNTMDKGMSRRRFLKKSAAVSFAAAASQLNVGVYAAGNGRIRVGLIGSGGRGADAMLDCAKASAHVELVAMGDLFRDRVRSSGDKLREGLGERFKVGKDSAFVGFDAYEKVIASDIDMVIHATPPHWRAQHIKAAIEAGKHVFMEKPAGVDPVALRSLMETADLAEQKGLAIVAGTQRRHQKHYVELMKRVHEGAIGEIKSAYAYWCGGDMIGYWKWYEPSEYDSEMGGQCRNWPWYVWTSGDHYVEQHVHNLDIMKWALDANPVKALGMGGRAVRTQGNIYDHFAVEYEYENGVRVTSLARQINGCSDRVSEFLVGTKGTCYTDGNTGWIEGENAYKYEGDNPNPYVQEHADLIDSIKAGRPLNEGKRVAESTMMAVLGRTSAYTGRELNYSWVMNASKLDLRPDKYEFGDAVKRPVAKPGVTQLI
jgi:predicted dehydrogenase